MLALWYNTHMKTLKIGVVTHPTLNPDSLRQLMSLPNVKLVRLELSEANAEAGLQQIVTRAINQVNELVPLTGLAKLPVPAQVVQVLDMFENIPVWDKP